MSNEQQSEEWRDFWRAGLQVIIPCVFALLMFAAVLSLLPLFIWMMRHIP